MDDATARHVSLLAAPIFAAMVGALHERGRESSPSEAAALHARAVAEALVLWGLVQKTDAPR